MTRMLRMNTDKIGTLMTRMLLMNTDFLFLSVKICSISVICVQKFVIFVLFLLTG